MQITCIVQMWHKYEFHSKLIWKIKNYLFRIKNWESAAICQIGQQEIERTLMLMRITKNQKEWERNDGLVI